MELLIVGIIVCGALGGAVYSFWKTLRGKKRSCCS